MGGGGGEGGLELSWKRDEVNNLCMYSQFSPPGGELRGAEILQNLPLSGATMIL